MQAVELADGLDRAQKQAVQMGRETVMTVTESDPSRNVPFESDCSLSAFTKRKCFFCGGKLHASRSCPAVNAACHNCNKRGHFAKVCKSKAKHTSDNVLVGSAAGALAPTLGHELPGGRGSKLKTKRTQQFAKEYIALLKTSKVCNRILTRSSQTCLVIKLYEWIFWFEEKSLWENRKKKCSLK